MGKAGQFLIRPVLPYPTISVLYLRTSLVLNFLAWTIVAVGWIVLIGLLMAALPINQKLYLRVSNDRVMSVDN